MTSSEVDTTKKLALCDVILGRRRDAFLDEAITGLAVEIRWLIGEEGHSHLSQTLLLP